MEKEQQTQVHRGMVITAKYLGQTNHRRARVKATHNSHCLQTVSATVEFDHSLDAEENYRRAALALAAKLSEQNEYFTFEIHSEGFDTKLNYFILKSVDKKS